MTPGMLDQILEFHQIELRRTFGQVAAAAANIMRSGKAVEPWDFFPGEKPKQTGAQQMELLKSSTK
jgi:hypothetical protein